MKRLLVGAVVLAAIALSAGPANAEPGKGEGPYWFTTTQVCDGQEMTFSAHNGVWSAVYSPEDSRHFIVVRQTFVEIETGTVLFDARKKGHSNQGPFTTCQFELPIDFAGFPVAVEAEGFWRP